jgi:hypothetical protein
MNGIGHRADRPAANPQPAARDRRQRSVNISDRVVRLLRTTTRRLRPTLKPPEIGGDMSSFYIPLHDVWAMGFAVTMAIALFATLFVVPFAVVWFVVRGVGGAWRWSAERTGDYLRGLGRASRHAFGTTVRSRKT